MLTRQIAEKILARVAGLTDRSLSVVDADGTVLATNDPQVDESIDLKNTPWTIKFRYGGNVVGQIVLTSQLDNQSEVAPLICAIAELVMHQSILIETIPHQEERLDKFVYDLLHQTDTGPLATAEARLFEIDLDKPRIVLLASIQDDILLSTQRIPTGEREIRITRYRLGISRALSSYYTSSRDNIVAYLGQHNFCVLKELTSESQFEAGRESFKKSLPTIYNIVKGETKVPTAIGVGNYHPGARGLRQSYHEAQSALDLGGGMWGNEGIYHIDDFGVVAPLLSGIDEHNIYFSRDLLEKLGRNEEMIGTLEAFFDLDMSLTKTADQLSIHRNTLVYRLDRIRDSLGLDPRKFDDAAEIKLAILFNRFVEGEYAN